jgi:hypothetical protein
MEEKVKKEDRFIYTIALMPIFAGAAVFFLVVKVREMLAKR